MVTYLASQAQKSIIVGALEYPTTLTLTAPSSVSEDTPFTVSGRLTYNPGTVTGIDGMTINLVYDGTSLGTAQTSGGGYFSKSVIIGPTGTFVIVASFAGVAGLAASESDSGVLVGETMGIAPLLGLGLIVGAILFGGKL